VVKSGQVCSGQVRLYSSQVRPSQATVRSKSCKVMPGQDSSDHVKFMSRQLKSGRVRTWLGLIRSDQIWSGQVRSGKGKAGQIHFCPFHVRSRKCQLGHLRAV